MDTFEFKAVSLLLLLGYLLIDNGVSYAIYKPLGVIPLLLPPILVIIGAIISLSPTFINPNSFSRTSRFWKIIGILVICSYFLRLLYSLIIGIPINYSLSLVTLILFILLVYFIIRNIRSEASLDLKGKIKEKSRDILGMFTKPQRITEEEVSISIEKKICLVCKGKVGGVMFMCTGCGALYCIKCSEALSNLENLCWACDSPIDKSNPVKPFKEEKEEVGIEVSEEALKKPKK